LVCSDAADASGASSVAGKVAAFDVQPAETVTCTWTNTKADPERKDIATAVHAPAAVEVAPQFTG
jgi:hypothetical protein